LPEEAEMLGLWRVAVAFVIWPIAAATAAGPLDGAYEGQSSLLRGGPPTCAAPGKVSWTITDGHFAPNWYKTTIPTEVGANGSIKGSVMYTYGSRTSTAAITGIVANGALEADIESTGCKYHYSLKKT
jgi:hypothetical protein